MRKLSVPLIALITLLGCNKQDLKTNDDVQVQYVTSNLSHRNCAANDVLEEQLKAEPGLRERMEQIESFTQKAIKNPEAFKMVNGVLTIPVVVHVVYNATQENISDAQVKSQIDVLNEDYNNSNKDNKLVPAEFKPVQASVGVRFVLDRIIRKKTTATSFGTNDAVKRSATGGDEVVDPSKYLNMWTCNLGQNLLGYAQFPGGKPSTDGVVILYSAFGRTGTLINTYDKGRTATHEVGHWMNLRHIWGDRNCGTDYVDDTPVAATSNFGCPNYPKYTTCTGGKPEMTMNYMDYTDDACMYMFSNGQKARMLAIFATGGPRATMAQ